MTQTQKYNGYQDWKSWNEGFGDFANFEKRYYEIELKEYLREGMSILEIGFGNGSFAGYCKSKNYNYVGTELIDELLDNARKNKFEVYKNILDIPSVNNNEKKFDLVLAFDVFEHISPSDLIQLLEDLKNYLNPKAKVIARFPNGNSPLSMYTQNGDYTHINYIGSSKIEHMASVAGYKLVKYRSQRAVILEGYNPVKIAFRILKFIYNKCLEILLATIMYKNPKIIMSIVGVAVLEIKD